jgi:hypothetical protein
MSEPATKRSNTRLTLLTMENFNNSITYQRVRNLGNYETKRLEMTVHVEPGTDMKASARQLMKTVDELLFEDKKIAVSSEPF